MTYPRNTFNSDEGVHPRTGLMRFAGEITLLAGLGVLVFVALALLSYSPQDAAWSTSGVATGALHNRAGRVGAWIADVAYALMGYSAWWCVAAALCVWMWGLASWMRGSVVREGDGRWTASWWAFWLGLALLLLTSCGLEWTRLHRWDGALPGSAGGVLGHVSGRLAVQWLGYTGSTLLELAALACALALVFRFSWGRVAERVGALAYDLLTGQRVLGWLRDRWAGWRAARARAKELSRARGAAPESVLPALTPLVPQSVATDRHFDSARAEPAFEAQEDAAAPAAATGAAAAPVHCAAWNDAVRPERVPVPSFLQGVRLAPQDAQQAFAGRQTRRRGWLGAALAPFASIFGRKTAPQQAERIEPQMYGQQQGSSVRDWRADAAPAAQQGAWAPTEQFESPEQAGEDDIRGWAGQTLSHVVAQSPQASVVQAARAALAARASRRMELLEDEDAQQAAAERAWAAAAAAYALEAERRRAGVPYGQPCSWADVDTSPFGLASADDNDQDFSSYDDAEASSIAAGAADGAAGVRAGFVVSNLNPVSRGAPDSAFAADEGEEQDSLPPLQAWSSSAMAQEPGMFLGPLPLPQLSLLDPAARQGEAVTPETLEMTSRL
ncbi:MAG: DNA translocase FtsK 4TM domain-containing protein, partial [Ottowia sp.]|nr:DNA translocase FtsK 4TM domain-containing protein [Ottowia sp.]